MKVYINGKMFEQQDAKISVFDHGLLYGDGIFEGIRIYDGCIYRLDEHLERLEKSARALLLDMPWSREEIAEAVCESCRVNNLPNGYIRLVVTRGVGTLGLSPKTCHDPQLIIIADKISLYPEEFYTNGLKIITVATRRNNAAALPPMVKSLNYLNNIFAKIDAQNAGFMEALMLNDEGNVAECTGDNFFLVEKGTLVTPPVSSGSLAGITRGGVIDSARQLGIPLVERTVNRYDVWVADEMFLTGTAAEVVPVVEVDARKIGDGKPGPVTLRLLDSFRLNVRTDGRMVGFK
ncbi:MAG: branched-chain-amino-acid transaminase [Opitutales bacterium]|jgi:branched-chain amino acid aminotransferase